MPTVYYRFLVRGQTFATAQAEDEVLLARELFLETDMGRLKPGDGATMYQEILYITPGWIDLEGVATGDVLTYDDSGAVPVWRPAPMTGGAGPAPNACIVCSFNGGTAALVAGSQCEVPIPSDLNGTIVGWRMISDQVGSVQIDVWKEPYTGYPPTDPSSITAAAVPAIVAGQKNEDVTLTGWDVAVAGGDTFRFNVDSCVTIRRATLILEVERTP